MAMDAGSRRSFLKAVNLAIGGVIAAAFAIPGLRYVLFPARRRVVDGPRDFVTVGDARAIGATPVRVEITAPMQRDAWARVENVRLGAAWLVRDGEGDIRALSTTCPHLGCAIDFDPGQRVFRCPCHTSAFALSGAYESGPAKRGMDPLEIRVSDEGVVSVRFRRFRLDVPEREEV
jgi:menaquinol-cytochrome c reductase iron-sulfur subunit